MPDSLPLFRVPSMFGNLEVQCSQNDWILRRTSGSYQSAYFTAALRLSMLCARAQYVSSSRLNAKILGGSRAEGNIITYSEVSQAKRVWSSFQTELRRAPDEVSNGGSHLCMAASLALRVNSA